MCRNGTSTLSDCSCLAAHIQNHRKSLALDRKLVQREPMNTVESRQEPRFRIEGPNGSGRAVLIIDAERVDLGPWEEAAAVMSRWLEATTIEGCNPIVR